MAKKKEVLPDVNKEHYFLTQKNIKVYPIFFQGNWYICLDNNGKIKQFEKPIKQYDVNLAVHKTIKYAHDRIVYNIPIQDPF